MKPAIDPSSAGRKRGIDLIGIVVTICLGIGGQIFVLDPIRYLGPQLPVLSRQDWPGSHETSGLEILEEWNDPELRSFAIRLERGQHWVLNTGAEIWQRAVWFADPDQAAQAWQRRDTRQMREFFNEVPIASTSPDANMPASVLYCDDLPDDERICAYFARAGNWYTEVWFWSGGSQFLSFAEIQALTERVNQLLLAAPAQP